MKSAFLALTFLALISLTYLSGAGSSPILWRDPGPVETLDLARGVAGGRTPAPPFRFVEEASGGTSPKLTVSDAQGQKWIVKFGEEARPETFASRIVWAAGYYADPDAFVRQGRIEGAPGSGAAAGFLQNGEFRDARFELVDEKRYAGNKRWTLRDERLKDTKELSGLKTLFVLLGNWDIKPENMAVLTVDGTQVYAVTDWGATMGRASDFSGRSKWDCRSYTQDSEHLVEAVENGFVVFNHGGKQSDNVLEGVRIEHVDWIMQRLGKLTDGQIRAALESSGATAGEVSCVLPAFRTRLKQLAAVRDMPPDGGTVTRTRREIKVIRKQVPQ